MDGATVNERLRRSKNGVIEGKQERSDGGGQIWRIEKAYDEAAETAETAKATKGGAKKKAKDEAKNAYGVRINVFVDSIGKTIPEFLVDFDVLVAELAARGVRPLDAAELRRAGLPASSQMFQDVYLDTPWKDIAAGSEKAQTLNPGGKAAAAYTAADVSVARMVLQMDDVLKEFSFLNRWFVFIKA
jgi:hypothetical protein